MLIILWGHIEAGWNNVFVFKAILSLHLGLTWILFHFWNFIYSFSASDIPLLWESWRDDQPFINRISEKWTSQGAQACSPNLGRVGHRAEGIEKGGMSVLNSRYFRSNARLHKVRIIYSSSSLRCRRAIDRIHCLRNTHPWKIPFKIKFCPVLHISFTSGHFLGNYEVNVTIIFAFSLSFSLLTE